jgi:periplasmic protein CpxP/Spy
MGSTMNVLFRSLALRWVLTGLALAGGCGAPALARAPNARSSAGATAPTTQAPFDPIAARIKYLHDRLRISPEQEALWAEVALAIRDNAHEITPFLRERLRASTSGSALDILHSYDALGNAQLNSLNKFTAAFEPSYDGLSEGQKKIADAVLRQGPLSTMVGGIPAVPAPFGYRLASPGLWMGLPLFVHPHVRRPERRL